MQCIIVGCTAIQFNVMKCSAFQCSIVLCNSMQCSAMQYSTVLCRVMHYNSMQLSAIQCSAKQYSAPDIGLPPWEERLYKNSPQCTVITMHCYLHTAHCRLQCSVLHWIKRIAVHCSVWKYQGSHLGARTAFNLASEKASPNKAVNAFFLVSDQGS